MVGPIDMASLLSQTSATEKVQQVQQQHPDMAQREFALMLQEERKRKSTDVQDTTKTEETKVEDEQKKGRQGKEEKEEASSSCSEESMEILSNDIDEMEQGKIVDIRV